MPALARELFGRAAPLAARYAELLADAGVARGLLGPREAGVIWSRHILNCAALLPLVQDTGDVIDVGSGAGLPGIVVALGRPECRVTLLEPMARRCRFLTEVAAELGLGNVSVERGRAEDVAGRLSADVVVARAVAPLARLIPLVVPLLRRGGVALALKGADAAAEVAAAQPVLRSYGARADIRVVDAPGTAATATVVRVLARSR